MNNKKFLISACLILFFGISAGWIIRSKTFDPKASFPKPIRDLLTLFIQNGKKIEEDLLYLDTDLTDFIKNGSYRTKVAVSGKVSEVISQPDGDYHVIISDPQGFFLVTEFIPEIKLSPPKKGEKIKIWGITHFDYFHNWWEIHPVIGWSAEK